MNSMQSMRIISLVFLIALAVAGSGCSGDDNPAASEDPNATPGRHTVIYEVTARPDGMMVDIDWVDNNGRELSETVRVPVTRQALRFDGDLVGLRVHYRGSIALIRAKIFVDDAEWAFDASAGSLVDLEIGGTL